MKGLVKGAVATSYALFLAFIFCVSLTHLAQHISQKLGVIDFVNIYMAGCITLSSDAHQIYDPSVQLKWQRALVPDYPFDKPFYCQYVPFFFPLMTPLALFSMQTAYIVWLIVCLPFGFGALFFLLSRRSALSRSQIAWVLIATGLSSPNIMNISIGQNGILMLGLVSLFFDFLLSKKYIPAALALALTSFKPHYSLFLLMPALAQRRWKLIAWLAIFELSLLALSGLTVGWQNVFSYPAILAHAETTGDYIGVHGGKMVSVRGLFSCLGLESIAMPLSVLAMLGGMTATYVIWSRRQSLNVTQPRLAIALTILLCLTTSPHSHLHDLILLALLPVTLSTIDFTKIIVLKPSSRLIWYLIIYLYPVISWGLAVLWTYQESAPGLLFLLTNAILLVCGFHLFVEQAGKQTD